MNLKKHPSDGHYYLHTDQGQPLICPHQDNGTEIIVEPNRLQPNQPPKQTIQKQHMVCGTWCALFRAETGMDAFTCQQLCGNGQPFSAQVKK